MKNILTFKSTLIFKNTLGFILFTIILAFSNVLQTVSYYESKAEVAYKRAKEDSLSQNYINSLVNYVESITYYTLAYHMYIDKLKDKDNFFRVSENVLNLSMESDLISQKALEQTRDNRKKQNILAIKSSNYLNFASTLQKMYGVDYKIATQKYDKLNFSDSIILTIAKYFAKSIDIQLNLNNYEKAKEYFSELEKYYKVLDNRIKDKHNVKNIVDFYKKKLSSY